MIIDEDEGVIRVQHAPAWIEYPLDGRRVLCDVVNLERRVRVSLIWEGEWEEDGNGVFAAMSLIWN
jgi:hypothetical protein